MSFKIVKASGADAVDMAYIKQNAWKESYYDLLPADYIESQTEFELNYFNFQKKSISDKNSLYVANVNNVIVGMFEIKKNSEEDFDDTYVQIDNVCILPTYWNRGFGKKTFKSIRKILKSRKIINAYVWIFPQNSRSRYFFEKCGFVADGKERTVEFSNGSSLQQVRMVTSFVTENEKAGE